MKVFSCHCKNAKLFRISRRNVGKGCFAARITHYWPVLTNRYFRPWHKLDKCLCLPHVFSFVFACAKSAHVFQKLSYSFCGLCLQLITLPQTERLFYILLRSQAPQQQYTVHCMHYSIILWAHLSEPLVKESQMSKFDGKNHNTACSSYLITHYHYVRVMDRYTETLHMKKMASVVVSL